jgi:hypothetical protein
MQSLSDKVRLFLKDAGFQFAGDRCSNLELLRYFEREYGLEVMRFMEEEWVKEQLDAEASEDFFTPLRRQVEQEDLAQFDRDLSTLGHRAA